MCNWVTMLYSGKLTEHCKQGIMEKNKNHYIKNEKKIFLIKKKKKKNKSSSVHVIHRSTLLLWLVLNGFSSCTSRFFLLRMHCLPKASFKQSVKL